MDLFVALAEDAEGDARHWALFEGDTCPGFDFDAGVEELTVAQEGVAGRGEINLANDFDDDLGFPRAHAGASGDFVDHALVLGFGGEPAGLFGLHFLCSDFHGGGVFVVCLTTPQ